MIQDILWNYKYFMIIMEEVYLDWDPDMVPVNSNKKDGFLIERE